MEGDMSYNSHESEDDFGMDRRAATPPAPAPSPSSGPTLDEKTADQIRLVKLHELSQRTDLTREQEIAELVKLGILRPAAPSSGGSEETACDFPAGGTPK
jgi:hypothetical protein